jgi:hypothetical protein
LEGIKGPFVNLHDISSKINLTRGEEGLGEELGINLVGFAKNEFNIGVDKNNLFINVTNGSFRRGVSY